MRVKTIPHQLQPGRLFQTEVGEYRGVRPVVRDYYGSGVAVERRFHPMVIYEILGQETFANRVREELCQHLS